MSSITAARRVPQTGTVEEYTNVSTIGIDTAPAAPAPLPSCQPLPSYWLKTSDATTPGVENGCDGLPAQADVVVIGSGISGTSTILHLATTFPQNSRLLLLEARDFCSGATGRNGGHLTPLSALAYEELASNPAHLLRHLHPSATSEDAGRRVEEVVRTIFDFEYGTMDKILALVKGREAEIGLVQGGNWHLCFQQEEVDEFERSLRLARESGLGKYVERVRRVPRDEIEKTMNHPAGVVAAYAITGNTLHPRKLVQLLLAEARQTAEQRNVTIDAFAHCPVNKVEEVRREDSASAGGRFRVKVHVGTDEQGEQRSILTRYVVHATNGYVSHLVPQLAGSTGVLPTRAQVVAIEPRGRAPTSVSSGGAPYPTVEEQGWNMVDAEPLPTESIRATDTPTADPTPSAQRAGQDDGHNGVVLPMGIYMNAGYDYCLQRPVLPCKEGTGPIEGPLRDVKRPVLIFGGGRQVAEGREWGVADDSALNPTVTEYLHGWLPRTLPNDLGEEHAVLEWTGVMGYTQSRDPFVGPLPPSSVSSDDEGQQQQLDKATPGSYVCAGFSGHGMTRAFSCAEVVASMLVAEERGEEWKCPPWFPSCYLTRRTAPAAV